MGVMGHLTGGCVIEWHNDAVADNDVALIAAVIGVIDHVENLTLRLNR